MPFFGEIAQSVAQCKLLLLRGEYLFATWSVSGIIVVRAGRRQLGGNALLYLCLKIGVGHSIVRYLRKDTNKSSAKQIFALAELYGFKTKYKGIND